MTKVFRRRDGTGVCERLPPEAATPNAGPACGVDDGDGDYLNCPFTADEYARFTRRIVAAEKAALHDFDNTKFFEGCLPIEVMAHRGVDTLRFGPMKPVGPDRSADRPLAVRRRPAAPGQPRRRSLQPGRLPDADEVGRAGARAADDSRTRAGRVRPVRHDPSQHLHQRADRAAPTWQTRTRADLFFAGQVSGVEGYVESAASGLIAGRNAARLVARHAARSRRRGRRRSARSRYYVSHADPRALPADQHHVRHHAAADLQSWAPCAERRTNGRSPTRSERCPRSRRDA